jgi:hypothetical protein
MDHSVPLSMLFIDYILNAILFNPKHVVFSMCMMVLYGSVNLTITLVSGVPVYSILTWKDLTSLWYSLGFLVGTIIAFLILAYISIYKNSKFNNVVNQRRISVRQRQSENRLINQDSED